MNNIDSIEMLMKKHFGYYDAESIYPSSDDNKEEIKKVENTLVSAGLCISEPPEDYYSSYHFYFTDKGRLLIAQLRVKWVFDSLDSLEKDSLKLFNDLCKDKIDFSDLKDVDGSMLAGLDLEDEISELEKKWLITESCEESWDNCWWYYEFTQKGYLAEKLIKLE